MGAIPAHRKGEMILGALIHEELQPQDRFRMPPQVAFCGQIIAHRGEQFRPRGVSF